MSRAKPTKDTFKFEVRDVHGVNVGLLVFSDPENRNSMRVTSAVQLAKLLSGIENKADVLMLVTEGPVFCSGGNLSDHLKQGAARGKTANRKIAAVLKQLEALKIPTLAVIEGDVLGGGLELVSAFDFAIAVPHALFGFWQRRLGLAFGWGGGRRLVRRLGEQETTRAALRAELWTASEALAQGLITDIAAPWNIREKALEMAVRLGKWPKASVAALKAQTGAGEKESTRERKAFEALWYGSDHRSALAKHRSR